MKKLLLVLALLGAGSFVDSPVAVAQLRQRTTNFKADTVEEMLTSPRFARSEDGDVCVTARYSTSHTVGDGSGGEYVYDADSTATIDGGFVMPGPGGTLSFSGTTFNGNAGTGRWLAKDTKAIPIMKWGALGDFNTTTKTGTDDHNAIARCRTKQNRVIFNPGRHYLTSGSYDLANGEQWEGGGTGYGDTYIVPTAGKTGYVIKLRQWNVLKNLQFACLTTAGDTSYQSGLSCIVGRTSIDSPPWSTDNYIESVHCRRFDAAVTTNDMYTTRFTNFTAWYNNIGVHITNGPASEDFRACGFERNNYGVLIDDEVLNTGFRGCVFQANKLYAILAENTSSGQKLTISSDCYFESNGYGVRIAEDSTINGIQVGGYYGGGDLAPGIFGGRAVEILHCSVNGNHYGPVIGGNAAYTHHEPSINVTSDVLSTHHRKNWYATLGPNGVTRYYSGATVSPDLSKSRKHIIQLDQNTTIVGPTFADGIDEFWLEVHAPYNGTYTVTFSDIYELATPVADMDDLYTVTKLRLRRSDGKWKEDYAEVVDMARRTRLVVSDNVDATEAFAYFSAVDHAWSFGDGTTRLDSNATSAGASKTYSAPYVAGVERVITHTNQVVGSGVDSFNSWRTMTWNNAGLKESSGFSLSALTIDVENNWQLRSIPYTWRTIQSTFNLLADKTGLSSLQITPANTLTLRLRYTEICSIDLKTVVTSASRKLVLDIRNTPLTEVLNLPEHIASAKFDGCGYLYEIGDWSGVTDLDELSLIGVLLDASSFEQLVADLAANGISGATINLGPNVPSDSLQATYSAFFGANTITWSGIVINTPEP